MKIRNPEKPFNFCDCYLVFNKQMSRLMVHYVEKNPFRTRKSVTYARYLMCIKEGRILSTEEEVDHINGDKTDDRIENLQILTAKENIRKSFKDNNIERSYSDLICSYCCKKFIRFSNQVHGDNNYCSRKCLYEKLKAKTKAI
jgi:hypothetical protein